MAMAAIPDAMGAWYDTGNGWAIAFSEDASASIVVSRKGAIRWRFRLSGRAGSALSAQARLEQLALDLGLHATDAPSEPRSP
jgi:hypothetical protein